MSNTAWVSVTLPLAALEACFHAVKWWAFDGNAPKKLSLEEFLNNDFSTSGISVYEADCGKAIVIEKDEQDAANDDGSYKPLTDKQIPLAVTYSSSENYAAGEFCVIYDERSKNTYSLFSCQSFDVPHIKNTAAGFATIAEYIAYLDHTSYYPTSFDWNRQAELFQKNAADKENY